jgi:hypothetical protein
VPISFSELFAKATTSYSNKNGFQPRTWQARLANHPKPVDRLIRIPTGEGKTLAAMLTWIFWRITKGDKSWPTRLVWCLPMRTLVEQSKSEAEKLLTALDLTDEVDVRIATHFIEVRVFREEAIAGVNGFGVRNFGGTNNLVNSKVAVRRARVTHAVGFVGKLQILAASIGFTKDGDRLDAQLFAGSNDSKSNFASVGDQNSFVHKTVFSVQFSVFRKSRVSALSARRPVSPRMLISGSFSVERQGS